MVQKNTWPHRHPQLECFRYGAINPNPLKQVKPKEMIPPRPSVQKISKYLSRIPGGLPKGKWILSMYLTSHQAIIWDKASFMVGTTYKLRLIHGWSKKIVVPISIPLLGVSQTPAN